MRLNQVIAAQRAAAAANSGHRNMGQEGAFLGEAFRQQALKASANRP